LRPAAGSFTRVSWTTRKALVKTLTSTCPKDCGRKNWTVTGPLPWAGLGKTRTGGGLEGVGLAVAWAVAVGVEVGWETVTVAPGTGRPLKSRACPPLVPLAPVALNW